MVDIKNKLKSADQEVFDESPQLTQYVSGNKIYHIVFVKETFHDPSNGNGHSCFFTTSAYGQRESWKITIFPNGIDKYSFGYTSVYTLMTTSSGTNATSDVNMWITMTLENCKEKSINDFKISRDEFVGIKRVRPYNHPCKLVMSLIICNEEKITPRVNYTDTLLDQKGDVTLYGEDWKLTAHKDVLSKSSPVFKAMFEHDMTESKTGEIKLNHLEGSIVKLMLWHVYTKKLAAESLDEFIAEKLLVAADMYCIEDLKKICETCICRTTSLNNITQRLIMADKYKLQDLVSKCFQIVRLFPDFVVTDPGWEEVSEKLPMLAGYIKQQISVDEIIVNI